MKKITIALAGCVLSVALVASAATGAPGGAALAGSTPAWANGGNYKAAANATDWVNFRVYLGLRNQAQAESLAQAVSTPGSSSYGKYLTPGQFRQRFAPTQSQVNDVRSWLQGQGFSIVYTPTNNHYVSAEGTAAQVESAFGVKLNEYSVNGLTLRAPSTALNIPNSLASEVVAVLGIDQSAAFVQPLDRADSNAPPSPGFRNAPPCSHYWGEVKQNDPGTPTLPGYPAADSPPLPYAPCGYTPPQFREAYGLSGISADGSGVTVAIIDAYASPTIFQDVQQYDQNHDSSHVLSPSQFHEVVAPGTYRRPENPRQDPQGWYGEETLDVEAVHATAPGASIVYVGAPNNFRDLDAAMNHVVDRHLADIVTNSYGYPTEFLPGGFIKPDEDTFLQAAIEGITVLFSSGDDGDELGILGYRTADWPASSPLVTAVGGTSLAAGTKTDAGAYQFETGWSTTRNRINCSGLLAAEDADNAWCPTEAYLYGSGGGASRLFPQPWWQAGVVPDAIAQPSGFTPGFAFKGRAVPDISADGDPNTGMLVGQTQTFSGGVVKYDEFRLGGTSLSSPLMAGMFAVVQQLRGLSNPLGFVNPMLYKSISTSTLHDIQHFDGQPAGVLRADYANSEDASDGILYSVRTLDFRTANDGYTVNAPAKSDYSASIYTRPGYDDVTGLGTPTSSFYGALASATRPTPPSP